MSGAQPWLVVPSPTDPEMYAVEGVYLVADNLPIEDANLIAAAPALLEALEEATETLRHIAKHWPDSFAAHHARAGFKKTCAAIASVRGAA